MSRVSIAGSILFSSLALFGCKNNPVVDSFSYTTDDNTVGIDVGFNKDFQMNTEATIPILEYGELRFGPNDSGTGFKVGGSVNMDVVKDSEVISWTKTRLLPNGQPMPSYVTTEVGRLRIRASGDVYANAYVGTENDNFFLGVALELSFLDQRFPAGLVISQTLRDKDNHALGVVTVYGPKVTDGKVDAAGGFLLMTNVTDLVKYHPGTMTFNAVSLDGTPNLNPLVAGPVEINSPWDKVFHSERSLRKLWKQFNKAAAQR